MNNILLILEREYLERVTKKSFLIVTLLMPIVFGGLMVIPGLLATYGDEAQGKILVIDDSGWFSDGFEVGEYEVVMSDESLEEAKSRLQSSKELYGVLYIPKMTIDEPQGIRFYSETGIGFLTLKKFEDTINDKVRDLRIRAMRLDDDIVSKLDPRVNIATFSFSNDGESKEMNTAIASVLGYVIAFLIYIFILVYGAFIMQSVLSEKTSKIVEVIISSIRPIELMLGKVLGVAAVAFTQFTIWIILVTGIVFFLSSFFGYIPPTQPGAMSNPAMEQPTPEMIQSVLDTIYNIPIAQIVVMFLLYFLGGFFLYGGLFAAVGSSVDTTQEAQQFTFPLSLPIIVSIMLIPMVGSNPDSPVALTLSIVPFTSPILMMARIPFGVPVWQLVLSLITLYGCVLATMWVAGRIYRIGILSTGAKVNYKTLWKWIMMKY